MTTISIACKIKDEMPWFKLSYQNFSKLADEIVIVLDSKSGEEIRKYISEIHQTDNRVIVYERVFDTHTKQKQYLLEKCTKEWIFFLDGDEILSDNCLVIRNIIESNPTLESYSIQGHHFIYNLSLEDNTFPQHYWRNRLVKRNPELHFEGENHEILRGCKEPIGIISDVRIFHMGYIKHLSRIMNKYNVDINQLQIHTKEYLEQWKDYHIFGDYPVKKFDINLLPEPLRDYFKTDDYINYKYFKDRTNIEAKHFIEAYTWKNYFCLNEKSKILDIGCGAGLRVFAFETYGIKVNGIDINKWIIEHSTIKDGRLKICDVLDLDKLFEENEFDFVYAYDILEHVEYKDIDKALQQINKVTKKHILISIPVIGDPNLEKDDTHRIKEKMEWWISKVKSNGFEIQEVPDYFLFKNQLIIGVKK